MSFLVQLDKETLLKTFSLTKMQLRTQLLKTANTIMKDDNIDKESRRYPFIRMQTKIPPKCVIFRLFKNEIASIITSVLKISDFNKCRKNILQLLLLSMNANTEENDNVIVTEKTIFDISAQSKTMLKKVARSLNIDKKRMKNKPGLITAILIKKAENRSKRIEKMTNSKFFMEKKTDTEFENEFSYRDIYVTQFADKNLKENLNENINNYSVSNDVSQIIVNYATTTRQIPETYDYQESMSITHENEEKEIAEHKEIHCKDDHECTYENCYNQFYPQHLYRIGFSYNLEDDYCENWYNENYKHIDKYSLQPLSHKNEKTFQLVSGWENQIIPIENGNCLKDSLFKMREMIIEKYGEILEFNKFGVINNEKEFTRLANSIDDHDINSLHYFSFLLSTGSIYFINSDGREIFGNFNSWNILQPSFYSCFFLIEQNDDGTGHISPINFGVLKTARRPAYSTLTKIKKLYGKKDKNSTKTIADRCLSGCYWSAGLVDLRIAQYFNDNYGKVKSGCKLENISIPPDFELDEKDDIWLTPGPIPPAHVVLKCVKEDILPFIVMGGGKKQCGLKETRIASLWQMIWNVYVKNNKENCTDEEKESLEYLNNFPESSTNNKADINEANVYKKKKNFETYDNKPAKDRPKKRFYDYMKKRFPTEMEKIKRTRSVDDNICYMTQDIKNEKVSDSLYRNICLIEYKQPGLLDLFTCTQAKYYQLRTNQVCEYVLCTSFLNNILYKHSVVNNEHLFEIVWNDTIYRKDAGFTDKVLCNFFGCEIEGTTFENRNDNVQNQTNKYSKLIQKKNEYEEAGLNRKKLTNDGLDTRLVYNDLGDEPVEFYLWILMKFWVNFARTIKTDLLRIHNNYKEHRKGNSDNNKSQTLSEHQLNRIARLRRIREEMNTHN